MTSSSVRNSIRFLLNDREINLDSVGPSSTLLDFLRIDRGLTGTKEGCAEGDCGACTVLVGRLKNGNLSYESVNACIRFVGSLDGCHVVTVEHLNRGDTLHPVQQAMVDFHGSQCGFCTPGFVMSLYALWMQDQQPDDERIEKALQGNLCRCTGYEAIMRAARAISSYGDVNNDPLTVERAQVIETLGGYADGKRIDVGSGQQRFVLPANVEDLAAVLAAEPNATIVAGATDVGLWVTKFMRDIAPVVFISHLSELHAISADDSGVSIGACVSYSAAFDALADQLPQLSTLIDRIAGEQIRNMGTIGGNIANGSPIGDMPPPLIALGATVTLRKGDHQRTIKLEEFFIDYGKQDREPGEFVESLFVPSPAEGAEFCVYKVSKRRDEDITAVLAAFYLERDDAGKVATVRVAYGGMAATPKRSASAEAALAGQSWDATSIEAAMAGIDADFTPLTDMRASSEYRALVARNLLQRFFLETTSGGAAVTVSRHAAA